MRSQWLNDGTRARLTPSLERCRFALQLLTPASILAKLNNRLEIGLEDVAETDGLFLDAKASASMLQASGATNYMR